jgi:hypothetical protein
MYIIMNVHLRFSCKVPVIVVRFLKTSEIIIFSADFEKNPQIPNFMKIRRVGAELFHAERRTYGHIHTTMFIVAFRNFANAPKKERRHCLDYSSSVQGEVWCWLGRGGGGGCEHSDDFWDDTKCGEFLYELFNPYPANVENMVSS